MLTNESKNVNTNLEVQQLEKIRQHLGIVITNLFQD